MEILKTVILLCTVNSGDSYRVVEAFNNACYKQYVRCLESKELNQNSLMACIQEYDLSEKEE